jgi:hypothetical protein
MSLCEPHHLCHAVAAFQLGDCQNSRRGKFVGHSHAELRYPPKLALAFSLDTRMVALQSKGGTLS